MTTTPITRSTFVAENRATIAAAQSMMVEVSEDVQGVKEIVPVDVRMTGHIPEGYSVDFVLDPSTIVSSLAKQGITTEDQLTKELIDELKATINAPGNLKIVPTSLYEQKLAAVEAAHEANKDT